MTTRSSVTTAAPVGPPVDAVQGSAPTTPERLPAGAVRASNAEREETISRLHVAVGEGRLDLDEAEERIAAVYGFRYREQLPAVLQDLPLVRESDLAGDPPTWGSIWASVVWRVLMVLHGAGVARPTAKQCRTGVAVAAVSALWFLGFVSIGARVMS